MTWEAFTIWAMDIWTFACSIVAPFAVGYILRGRGLDKVLADIAGKSRTP